MTATARNMAATAPDHDEIVRVVQLYVDGVSESSVAKLEEAFHEDAWIFYTDAEGGLHKGLISDFFEEWAAPKAKAVGRYLSVRQAGDVASVLLGFDYPDGPDDWVDFHSLIRVDRVWKITNKTATHRSRAGGQ
jgi:hypothetical protein